jgi:hypothetical protein
MTRSGEKTISKNILSAIKTGINRVLRRLWIMQRSEPKVFLNYNEFCSNDSSKRALVSYLVAPLLPPEHERDRIVFSNLGIAQQIPRALNELGYIVDIIQYDLINWNVSRKYDLFLGHAGINFEQISRQLPNDSIQIYFSTGIYWKEFNIQEAKRIYELALRRGHLLQPDRRIQYSEEYANKRADGIICLGNKTVIQTYNMSKLVIGINNATYPVTWSEWRNKDFDSGRQHFLFFSGGGNVHKGLDLILEAFAETKLHLHVCQNINPNFGEVYRQEIRDVPNIHIHGALPMRSSEFESLAMLCNWIISATCAEGQPGAIIECMGYGLIPILPESSNISLGEFGIGLQDCIIDIIRETALRASQIPVEECRQRSLNASATAQKDYSPERFNQNFKSAVQQIVDSVKE